MVIIIAAVVIEHGQQAIVQSLEGLLGIYIGYITFGIDIAAGVAGLMRFCKTLFT